MTDKKVKLIPLQPEDREQFILDNQEAFNFGALEEFGRRDEHFEEDGEIISRETIEQSIDSGEAYRILLGGRKVGGVVVKTMATGAILSCCLFRPISIAKGLGMVRGGRSSGFTRRFGYGKP